MQRHERSAPIWLFSFVDLAFLLLIAFTQIGADDRLVTDDLVRVELPRLHGSSDADAGNPTAGAWQLRVVPAATVGPPHRPFALVEPAASEDATESIDALDLESRLALLGRRGADRPLLLPHPDARAEDLLVAADLIERVFRTPRDVLARPEPVRGKGTTDVAAP